MTEGGAFPPLPPPFVKNPSEQDGPQHDTEVNEDEVVEADGNHGTLGVEA